MELRYTVIDPTKNITLLVTTPVPRDVQPRVAAELLRREEDAEQVGFAEGLAAGKPRLQMMGGEFCGNATMSMAAWLHRDLPVGAERTLALPVSGAPEPVACRVTRIDGCFIGTVAMPLPERIEKLPLPVCGVTQSLPVVFLPGICHVIVPADMIGRDRADETLQYSECCGVPDGPHYARCAPPVLGPLLPFPAAHVAFHSHCCEPIT